MVDREINRITALWRTRDKREPNLGFFFFLAIRFFLAESNQMVAVAEGEERAEGL